MESRLNIRLLRFQRFIERQANTLLVNCPAVGASKGNSTPKSMADAQELGVSYVETALRSIKLSWPGGSIGGAAMAMAVMKHDFKEGVVTYLSVSQMTFGRASAVSTKLVSKIAARLFKKYISKDVVVPEFTFCLESY